MNPMKKKKLMKSGIALLFIVILVAVLITAGNMVRENKVNKLLDLGNKYLENMDFERATMTFNQAIAIAPKCEEAYYGKAQAQYLLGQFDEAMETLQEGISRVDDTPCLTGFLQQITHEYLRQDSEEMELAGQELEREKLAGQSEDNLRGNVLEEANDLTGLTDKNAVKNVHFKHFYEEGNEYAVITGVNSSESVVWIYQTDRYEGAELDRVNDIARHGDVYYFCEDGIVTALNVEDGSILWKNSDFGGSVSSFVFGDEECLYLCGFYGPDFFAVDKNGKTLKYIDNFDADYYWAYQIDFLGDRVAVTLNGNNYDEEEETVFYINLDDFTYWQSITDGVRVQQKVYEEDVFAKMLVTNKADPLTCTSTLLISLTDGTKIAEIQYAPLEGVGLYGTVETGDLTGDGQDELLVNIQYYGSTFGATDVYVYRITDNGLEEIFQMDSDKISERFPQYSYGTGAVIDNGRLKIHALIGSGWERENEDILVEYKGGEWRIYGSTN